MDDSAFKLILMGLQYAPSIVDTGKDLFASLQGLTEDQSTRLAAAQETAHASLQAAVAAAVAEEKAAPASGE